MTTVMDYTWMKMPRNETTFSLVEPLIAFDIGSFVYLLFSMITEIHLPISCTSSVSDDPQACGRSQWQPGKDLHVCHFLVLCGLVVCHLLVCCCLLSCCGSHMLPRKVSGTVT